MRNSDRFDKFTARAREMLALAQVEAQRLNHDYMGTEHILLGLIRVEDGIAADVLSSFGVRLEDVRRDVESIIGRGDRLVLGEVGLTPRAKKALELAVDEAHRFHHHYIGTEHILLGLIRVEDGIAAKVLQRLGVTLAQTRTRVLETLLSRASSGASAPAEPAEPSAPKNNVVTCRIADADLEAIDALIEAGVRSTRSDAAAWLIHAGIESNNALFEQVRGTVAEIRRLREVAQTLAQQLMEPGASQPPMPPTTPDHPETPDQPAS